jgi:hypothetical protein
MQGAVLCKKEAQKKVSQEDQSNRKEVGVRNEERNF